MAPETVDPRMMSIRPRIRYNTIGGVNGPLVILENVGTLNSDPDIHTACPVATGLASMLVLRLTNIPGQIPQIQRDRVVDAA